jgi:hypothetical protein
MVRPTNFVCAAWAEIGIIKDPISATRTNFFMLLLI